MVRMTLEIHPATRRSRKSRNELRRYKFRRSACRDHRRKCAAGAPARLTRAAASHTVARHVHRSADRSDERFAVRYDRVSRSAIRRRGLGAVGRQTVTFEQPIQAAPVNTQRSGGSSLIAPLSSQDLDDMSPLHRRQRRVR